MDSLKPSMDDCSHVTRSGFSGSARRSSVVRQKVIPGSAAGVCAFCPTTRELNTSDRSHFTGMRARAELVDAS
jgi:hypothetical protein